MKDLGEMFKRASEVQAVMQDFESDLKKQIIEGQAAGGLVRVRMDGQNDVHQVTIDESVMDDREMLEDLIAGAFNDAVQRIDSVKSERLKEVAGNLNLPPLPKWTL